MGRQQKFVKSFFDQLAPSYRQRYEGDQHFLKYLHEERLEKALQELDLFEKAILDIGAGTGILYDYIKRGQQNFDYFACDISEAMLEESQIPKDRRWVGTPQTCHFPMQRFDLIFLLGVTTYLSEEELKEMLDWIGAHISPDGKAVLSFSNRESLTFRFRKFMAPFLPKGILKRTVLGQRFSFRGYSKRDLQEILPGELKIETQVWMNATVFPLNRLFPQMSIRLSKWFLRRRLPTRMTRCLCGDFLLFLRRQ